jgi:hypothetical protein
MRGAHLWPIGSRRARFWLLFGYIASLIACSAWVAPAIAEDCVKPEWKIDGVRLPYASGRAVTDYVELGDVIAVKSSNLADLRKCASAENKLILLYLADKPLEGLAEFPPSNPADHEAFFTLQVNGKTRQVWNTLLGSPSIGELRPISVSLGLIGGYPMKSTQLIPLRPLPPLWFGLWAILFVVGLVAFFWFAARSNLLRGGTPASGRAFSIGRSQAAWWFFIVLAAYLLIGLTTGDYVTSLNSTALTLLGIAAGTHLGSVAVDAQKMTDHEKNAQKAALNALKDAKPDPDTAAKREKLEGKSQGWLIDVLSDADGIDFHRFQMLAWTFVLGVVFIIEVWQGLAMPDFSATLLGLMGLSAGTYVGLKIPEATKPSGIEIKSEGSATS